MNKTKINDIGLDQLYTACTFDRIDVVAHFLNEYDLDNETLMYVVKYSAYFNSIVVLKMLIERGIVNSVINYDILDMLFNNDQHKIIKILLEHTNVDPSSYGNKMLNSYLMNGSQEMIDLLLDNERVIDSLNITTLRIAEMYDRAGSIKKMLNNIKLLKRLEKYVVSMPITYILLLEKFDCKNMDELNKILKLL